MSGNGWGVDAARTGSLAVRPPRAQPPVNSAEPIKTIRAAGASEASKVHFIDCSYQLLIILIVPANYK